jgi:hypothetical protein
VLAALNWVRIRAVLGYQELSFRKSLDVVENPQFAVVELVGVDQLQTPVRQNLEHQNTFPSLFIPLVNRHQLVPIHRNPVRPKRHILQIVF